MYVQTTDKQNYVVFGQSDITVSEDKITVDGKGNKKHVICECPPEHASMVISALARLEHQGTPLVTQDTIAKNLRNAGYEPMVTTSEVVSQNTE
jgi:hypothetical protein